MASFTKEMGHSKENSRPFSGDICESINFASELECDIQVFLDENPSGVRATNCLRYLFF